MIVVVKLRRGSGKDRQGLKAYNIDNLAIHWEPRHQAWVVFCFVVGVSVGGFFRLKLYSTTMNGHGQGDT